MNIQEVVCVCVRVCVLSEGRDLDNVPYFRSLCFTNPFNPHIAETKLTETQGGCKEVSWLQVFHSFLCDASWVTIQSLFLLEGQWEKRRKQEKLSASPCVYLQVARMPEFELPSANCARAGAEPACVGEERKRTRYPDSVYVAQKLRCLWVMCMSALLTLQIE